MTAPAAIPSVPVRSRRGQLLLIESDPEVRESLRMALECEGFEVSSVGDGSDGVHRYAAGLFDLVLLDVNRPQRGGWEVLSGLQQVNPAVGVVLLSVHGDVYAAAAQAGVLAVCEKPLAIAALSEVLLRLVQEDPGFRAKRLAEHRPIRVSVG